MTVKLFGIAKEIAGSNTLPVNVFDNINTVGDLRKWLAQHYPAFTDLKSLAIAVDSEYAGDETSIQKNSEVALLPPVSGG